MSSPARPTLVLVHGAANSSGVWRFWRAALAELGWTSVAVDLRGHGSAPGDLAATSMRDYADDVAAALRGAGERPVVVGWSMGGLAAMMAAADGHASACVCLAPSMPARETDPSVPLRRGVFGPEEYGITSRDPAGQPAMPDLDDDERGKTPRRISGPLWRFDDKGYLHDRRTIVYLVDPSGGDPVALTDDAYRDSGIVWRRDGSAIGFLSARHDRAGFDSANQAWEVSIGGGAPT
ncbi:MAG: alpha/beta fold hydrolase, partial [Chloroflexi bacterium]|nr:alpha/beta fold hydrolase [Chloroflexota bacterium]